MNWQENPILDQEGLRALKSTLRDEDKILKVLIDRNQRLYAEYRTMLDNPQNCRIGPEGAVRSIGETLGHVWELMRDAYSQGPDFVYADPKKQRALRQALRVLNFSARVVSELLQDSEREYLHHRGENYYRSRLAVAQCALGLADRISSLVTPGPKGYNHPQFKKWHQTKARCQRRIAAIWTAAALDSDKFSLLPVEERQQ